MTDKKILTRTEFEQFREKEAAKMANDHSLQKDALDLLVRADEHSWIHQSNWFGEPILNLPQDMFALQDIIFRTQPDFIIELGVAWGGSLLFYSTIMEILGNGHVIGVDTFIPDDLKTRIYAHGSLSNRITLINGSSIAPKTLAEIGSIIGNSKKVMVILDSFHTHEHVLQELENYSPLVYKGFYLICCDTIVEAIPDQKHRPRPWGKGNNPHTAMNAFLEKNDRFETDVKINNRLLFTCNPGGYLKCIKNI